MAVKGNEPVSVSNIAAAEAERGTRYAQAEARRDKTFSDTQAQRQAAFEQAETARQQTFNTNEADRGRRSNEAVQAANKATERANDAAEQVEQALNGNLDPMFRDWIDAQKDVAGGLVSYDRYQKEKAPKYPGNSELLEYLEIK